MIRVTLSKYIFVLRYNRHWWIRCDIKKWNKDNLSRLFRLLRQFRGIRSKQQRQLSVRMCSYFVVSNGVTVTHNERGIYPLPHNTSRVCSLRIRMYGFDFASQKMGRLFSLPRSCSTSFVYGAWIVSILCLHTSVESWNLEQKITLRGCQMQKNVQQKCFEEKRWFKSMLSSEEAEGISRARIFKPVHLI